MTAACQANVQLFISVWLFHHQSGIIGHMRTINTDHYMITEGVKYTSNLHILDTPTAQSAIFTYKNIFLL